VVHRLPARDATPATGTIFDFDEQEREDR
jgi:hypothetical protein